MTIEVAGVARLTWLPELPRLLCIAALVLTCCAGGTPTKVASPVESVALGSALSTKAAVLETAIAPNAVAFSGEVALAHVRRLSETIGPRPAGSSSDVAAADYIAEQLSAAGYQVERQHFTFPQFEERSASLSVTWDRGASETSVETHALLYSGAGGVNGRLAFAGFGRSDDFRGLDLRGAVVLMERGADVTFRDKAERAFAAGAAAAVIYNNTPRPFLGSLQVGMPLPVLAISGAGGQRLRTLMDAGPVMAHVAVDATVDERPAQNVVGTRPAPSAGAATVVIGAHYDSVQISPGANDNASGAAVVLEMARVLAHDPPQANIVFVSFAAEELGLLGSAHFVGALHPDARASVAAMLNFDMVGVGEDVLIGGSPALVRTIEGVGAEQGLKLGHMGSSLTGRSDHASFVAAGIPSAFFHVSDDPNYHTPADVVDGISTVRLAEVGTLGTEVVRRLARG